MNTCMGWSNGMAKGSIRSLNSPKVKFGLHSKTILNLSESDFLKLVLSCGCYYEWQGMFWKRSALFLTGLKVEHIFLSDLRAIKEDSGQHHHILGNITKAPFSDLDVGQASHWNLTILWTGDIEKSSRQSMASITRTLWKGDAHVQLMESAHNPGPHYRAIKWPLANCCGSEVLLLTHFSIRKPLAFLTRE